MSSIRFTVTGVGAQKCIAPIYNAGGVFSSSNAEGFFLFDCGNNILNQMHAAGLSTVSVRRVLTTHAHTDHIGGLELLVHNTCFLPGYVGDGGKGKKVDGRRFSRPLLYLPVDCVDFVKSWCAHGGLYNPGLALNDIRHYFGIRPIHDGSMFCWGGAKFTVIEVRHILPRDKGWRPFNSYGLFVQTKSGSLLLTSDIHPSALPGLMKWFEQATYIICDCEIFTGSPVHVHYEELCKLPTWCRERMFLTHCITEAGQVSQLPNEAADGFAGFLRQGQVIEIPL